MPLSQEEEPPLARTEAEDECTEKGLFPESTSKGSRMRVSPGKCEEARVEEAFPDSGGTRAGTPMQVFLIPCGLRAEGREDYVRG